MITQEQLFKLLHYDPDTGVFTWLVDPAHGGKKVGLRAGYKLAQGHIRIKIAGIDYPAHRLAYLYMVGRMPDYEMDHVNCVRDDNRWSNLRPATAAQNKANQHLTRANKSGWKGVTLSYGKWRAAIKVNGKYRHIGTYVCPAAASFAYQIAADKAFGEYARSGFQGA